MKNIVIKGLEDGDLSKYSIQKLGQIEGGRTAGRMNVENGVVSKAGRVSATKQWKENRDGELEKASIEYKREVDQTIFYEGIEVGTRRADFVVNSAIIVELKALINLEDVHLAQVKNYLTAYKNKFLYNHQKVSQISWKDLTPHTNHTLMLKYNLLVHHIHKK